MNVSEKDIWNTATQRSSGVTDDRHGRTGDENTSTHSEQRIASLTTVTMLNILYVLYVIWALRYGTLSIVYDYECA